MEGPVELVKSFVLVRPNGSQKIDTSKEDKINIHLKIAAAKCLFMSFLEIESHYIALAALEITR